MPKLIQTLQNHKLSYSLNEACFAYSTLFCIALTCLAKYISVKYIRACVCFKVQKFNETELH